MSYIEFVFFAFIGFIISLVFLFFSFAGFYSFAGLMITAYLIFMYLGIVIVLYRLRVEYDRLW